MTTIQFIYMMGVLWWILAGVVFTVVFNSKDDVAIRLFGSTVLFFIFVGGGHFAIAWLLNVDALPASWTFFN